MANITNFNQQALVNRNFEYNYTPEEEPREFGFRLDDVYDRWSKMTVRRGDADVTISQHGGSVVINIETIEGLINLLPKIKELQAPKT